jgi:hypothetical protein
VIVSPPTLASLFLGIEGSVCLDSYNQCAFLPRIDYIATLEGLIFLCGRREYFGTLDVVARSYDAIADTRRVLGQKYLADAMRP